MKILFLDIDGVLVTDWSSREPVCLGILPSGCCPFNPACVAELNMLCDTTGAMIVLSSSWRYAMETLETARRVLNDQGVSAPIIGMTEMGMSGKASRPDEVQQFVNDVREDLDSFVILDDCKYSWGSLADRWVCTEMYEGLTRNDTKSAIEILNTPMRS